MAAVNTVGVEGPSEGDAASRMPQVQSSGHGKTTVHPEAVDIWAKSVDSLSREQRDQFAAEMPDGDLLGYAMALEKMIAEKSESSRTLKLTKRIAPLINLFEMTKPFTDALNSVYLLAGMIFGGISFLLLASKRAVDYQEAIDSFLGSTLELLTILEGFKSAIHLTEEAQMTLAKIYGDIIQFLARLSKLFGKREKIARLGINVFLRSQVKTFEAEFQSVKERLRDHVVNFQLAANAQSQMDSMRNHVKTHEKLASMERDRKAQEARYQAELRRNMLKWISVDVSFQPTQDEKLGERLEGTGRWLLNHELFRAWKEAKSSQLLWIRGKAGSGKSHLAACAIDDLERSCKTQNSSHQPHIQALAYFYCNAEMLQHQNQRGNESISPNQPDMVLLSSVLRQLYEQLPGDQTVDSILQEYKDRPTNRLGRLKTKDGIRSVLCKFARAFIVVDGLDECSGLPGQDFVTLCEFLQSLTALDSKSIIGVAIFSRPNQPTLESTLLNSVKVAVDDGSNADDIKLFINERAKSLMKTTSASEKIKTELASRADGMSLWASLVIKDLKSKRTDSQRQKTLEETPSDLEAAYSASLRRIMAKRPPAPELGLKALLWVSNSLEPMTELKLVEALSFQSGMRSICNEDRVDGDMIISDCADLLIAKQDHYELLHPSLKEYLKTGLSNLSAFEEMHSMQIRANALLARRCFEYLQLEEFHGGPFKTAQEFQEKAQKYPLLKHASLHWGAYLRQSTANEGPDDWSSECSSLQNPGTCNFVMQIRRAHEGWSKRAIFPWPGQIKPLHVIASFGLDKLLRHFPEAASQIGIADGSGRYPVDEVLSKDHQDMLVWILDHRGNTQPSPEGGRFEPTGHGEPWYIWPLIIKEAWYDWDQTVLRLIKEGNDKDETNGFSQTALMAAADEGSFLSAEVLIKEGANINTADIYNDTALMYALRAKHMDICKLLIENGADADLQGRLCRTVLHHLSFEENEEWLSLIPLLRAHGAGLEAVEEDGQTPLLLSTHSDNAYAVQAFLDQGANISAIDTGQSNILHLAAASKSCAVMALILKCSGPNKAALGELARGKNKWGGSPLHRAALFGSTQAAKILLSSGLPSMDFGDADGWWPVHHAAKRGALKIVRGLVDLEAENANRPSGESGLTPLYLAAGEGYTGIVEYLLSVGADINHVTPEYGRTPLLQAIQWHNTATAVALFSNGANPCLADTEGDAALECAAAMGNRDVVHLLLDATSKYPIDQDQRLRALTYAVSYQHLEVVHLFLPSGEDSGFLSKMGQSSCGFDAVFGGNMEIWRMIASLCPSLSHAIDSMGKSRLHDAADRGHTHLVEYFCKQGLDLEKDDNNCQTPLFLAARTGSTNALLSLCREGANINHCDSFGRTALHWAASFGFTDTVKLLIREGADPYARDQAGFLAFDYISDTQRASLVGQYDIKTRCPATKQRGPQNTIASISRKILQLESPDETGLRSNSMFLLFDILLKLRAFKDASLAMRDFDDAIICSICSGTSEGAWYQCEECCSEEVCSSCYGSFFTKAGISRMPRGIQGIHMQEKRLHPVRRALFHAAQLGGRTLLEVLKTSEAFPMAFTRLSDLHKAWQAAYRLKGIVVSKRADIPGWELICIVGELHNTHEDNQKSSEQDGADTKPDPKPSLDIMTSITQRLQQLFRQNPAGCGIREFRCAGHEYFEVSTVEELPEEEKAYFDDKGALAATFFEMLNKKYSTREDVDATGDEERLELLTADPSGRRDSTTSEDLRTSSTEETGSTDEQKPESLEEEDDESDSDVFEDALEEQSTHSEQVVENELDDADNTSDDDASSDISVTTEVEEELHLFEDSEPGRIRRECNPDFDFDRFRNTLLDQMKGLGPDDGGREMRRKKTVLEAAWALAQAFAFEDETHFPSLAEYLV